MKSPSGSLPFFLLTGVSEHNRPHHALGGCQASKLHGPLLVKPLIFLFATAIAVMSAFGSLPTYPVYQFPPVTRKTSALPVAGDWKPISAGLLRHSMGNSLRPLPRVAFRIAYDADALYLFYKVKEYAVRAVARHHGDIVCGDSCVEFFFSPSEDLSAGYFNLEMNCGGTTLLHYHFSDGSRIHKTTAREFRGATVSTSLPHLVDPERKGPLVWTLTARIPFKVLQRVHPFSTPVSGTVWRANFFKCGDKTTRPHWLAWAKVNRTEPAFHVPEAFGRMVFQ